MAVQAAAARAIYAADASASRGRLHAEPLSPTRSDFRRDCDRIIHSTAFRRLAYKTQVFVFHEGDHYRTRLTHTLEVTQIARSLARILGLDEDLAEACALAHDLGHPPFGHAGERALDRCLAAFGGFDHNAQTLAVVTRLEKRYAAFDGLNLTWETLEGLVKHNGPLVDASGRPKNARGVAATVAEYGARHALALDSFPSLEAQAGAIADDIAYDSHDLDDGLRAGLFVTEELAGLSLVEDILDEVDCAHPGIDRTRRASELVRRMITRMIDDVVSETRRRVAALDPRCADDVRGAGTPMVGFSSGMASAERSIKEFLFQRMYRHRRVMQVMGEAEGVLRDLFARYVEQAETLPAEWRGVLPAEPAARARGIADFIAGMTDRYALGEHARLFDVTPHLR
ncbi:MAG: deoxyguanosinetriphosphate triphosphohydrolase [Xanthobacteraceae bacterium]